MHIHPAIAIVTSILVGFGLKLVVSPLRLLRRTSAPPNA